jgi:glutamate N-acetyltransferase/amino-acid N-acetyltransferase
MNGRIETVPAGTVTTPKGFLAGATYAGLKDRGLLDLGVLFSEVPCNAAGVFTTNKIKAAPVGLCQRHLKGGRVQAMVANSGCANACTGERGREGAVEMAILAAGKLGLLPEDVLVASTGPIGMSLPIELIGEGIQRLALSPGGGHELAKAIMTTDTFAKEIAVRVKGEDHEFTIGGIAKGAGMIHPDLATMLCFLTTDAAVGADFIQAALERAVDTSFNMITIDGDTSPNDSVILLANGLAGIGVETEAEAFQIALEEVCVYLARCVVRDGEGATRLIEVRVEGAHTDAEARLAARTIAGSPLVKAAVHGGDPNWGRIIAALGRSGVEVVESRIDLYLNNLCLMKGGNPLRFDGGEAQAMLSQDEVPIRVCLNLSQGEATAWGCDLSEEYVTINSAYMT